ncbi:unnamed protein product, partial [Brassica oleracea var. botrytis]
CTPLQILKPIVISEVIFMVSLAQIPSTYFSLRIRTITLVSVVDVVGHLRLVDGHPLHPRPLKCNITCSSSKVHCLIFSYKEIGDAMCGFDRILQISEGGFGSVYKAIINDPTATSGDSHSVPLALLGVVNDLNLVRLLGYCSEDTKSFLLWKQRLEIMLRAAQGLAYLHELQV